MAEGNSSAQDPFQLTDNAVLDIDGIWAFLLERDSLETADRIVLELFQTFYKIAGAPNSGHKRSDLTLRPVLFYRVFSYLIVYSAELRPVQILSVLHGKRNIANTLKRRLL